MKRIIYILAIVIALAITLGGVTAFADTTTDNLTRGTVFPASNVSSGQGIALASEEAASSPIAEEIQTDNDASDEGGEDSDPTSEGPAEGEEGENVAEGNAAEGGERESTAEGNAAEGGEATTPGETTADGEKNDSGDITEGGAETDTDGGEDKEKSNPFEVIFVTVKDYATEIFCALSFVGSVILAYAYKSGLLPIIKSGIGAISTTVSGIKEAAERGESKTDRLTSAVCDRLADAQICLDTITSSIDALGERLDGLESDADERRKLKVILAAQIDMLYSIFMTSSLPQYQKDEVGAKISEMREALLGYEGE